MEYERNFDDLEEFSSIETMAISKGIIVPVATVFYRPPCPIGQYDHEKRLTKELTKEAEETIQEIEREAKRIHERRHS